MEMLSESLSFCCLAFLNPNRFFYILCCWEVMLQPDVCRGQVCICGVDPVAKAGLLLRNTSLCTAISQTHSGVEKERYTRMVE